MAGHLGIHVGRTLAVLVMFCSYLRRRLRLPVAVELVASTHLAAARRSAQQSAPRAPLHHARRRVAPFFKKISQTSRDSGTGGGSGAAVGARGEHPALSAISSFGRGCGAAKSARRRTASSAMVSDELDGRRRSEISSLYLPPQKKTKKTSTRRARCAHRACWRAIKSRAGLTARPSRAAAGTGLRPAADTAPPAIDEQIAKYSFHRKLIHRHPSPPPATHRRRHCCPPATHQSYQPDITHWQQHETEPHFRGHAISGTMPLFSAVIHAISGAMPFRTMAEPASLRAATRKLRRSSRR